VDGDEQSYTNALRKVCPRVSLAGIDLEEDVHVKSDIVLTADNTVCGWTMLAMLQAVRPAGRSSHQAPLSPEGMKGSMIL
jgi:hypothetical protein